jgi:hypothetical protein
MTGPLSCRLLREIHGRLLARGRGADRLPGEFRRCQNWIVGTRPGNARFVPPPPALVEDCMGQLEQFIHGGHHGEHSLPVLVRAALAHLQFETIHPFLDGNGRLGRLLIVLMLIDAGVLQQPLLYLSLFFKQHRNRYYELLDGVRQQGDWEAWIDFFLEGVESTASAAVATAQRLLALFRTDEGRLTGLGRSGPSVRKGCAALRRRPLTSTKQLKELSGLSFPTAGKAREGSPSCLAAATNGSSRLHRVELRALAMARCRASAALKALQHGLGLLQAQGLGAHLEPQGGMELGDTPVADGQCSPIPCCPLRQSSTARPSGSSSQPSRVVVAQG